MTMTALTTMTMTERAVLAVAPLAAALPSETVMPVSLAQEVGAATCHASGRMTAMTAMKMAREAALEAVPAGGRGAHQGRVQAMLGAPACRKLRLLPLLQAREPLQAQALLPHVDEGANLAVQLAAAVLLVVMTRKDISGDERRHPCAHGRSAACEAAMWMMTMTEVTHAAGLLAVATPVLPALRAPAAALAALPQAVQDQLQ